MLTLYAQRAGWFNQPRDSTGLMYGGEAKFYVSAHFKESRRRTERIGKHIHHT
jgi:hypothetical protein